MCITLVCSKRKEARERGMELLQAGDKKGAMECFQRAVDVTPRMAFNLIELLRKENVEFYVAPYEADPQLTYLCLNGIVDAVISEDSDLIPYACPRMIYKLDKDGNGKEVQFRDLGLVKDLDLSRFSAEMFRHMCILSGCDYLESLPGMGLKKAHGLLLRHGTMGEIFKALESSKTPVPEGYALDFGRADLTFQHQIVYDPRSRRTVHLHPLPDDVDPATLPFTGEHLEDHIAQLIADGRIDPHTYEPFILSIPTVIPNSTAIYHPPNSASPSHHAARHVSSSTQMTQSDSFARNGSQMSVSGGTQPLSQTSTSTPTRLSTQWQTKSTTPLSALRQSFGSPRTSSSLSAAEVSKHDNDMTRDVQRYTMYRGNNKSVRNAATTASNIISSSVQLKPNNTINSYFAAAPSPSKSSPFNTQLSRGGSSSSLNTPTKTASTMSQGTPSPILRSRFFASSPTAPASPYAPNSSILSSSTVDLVSYGSILDTDTDELDDATEALLARVETSRPSSTQKRASTTQEVHTPSKFPLKSPSPKSSDKPSPQDDSSPSRFALPSKIITISLNDDSDEEFELVPVETENKPNGASFSLTPLVSTRPSSPRKDSPKTSYISLGMESAVIEQFESKNGDSILLGASSSSLVLTSSTNDLIPSIFDQIALPSSTNGSQPPLTQQDSVFTRTTSSDSLLPCSSSANKKRPRDDLVATGFSQTGSPPTKIKATDVNIFNLFD